MESEGNKLFTLTIYCEQGVGMLNQVAIIFTRRCLNIEDISASNTTIEGVHRITVTVWSTRTAMEKAVKQIEKRIDVLKAFLYTDDEIIYQEIALYKIDTDKLLKEQHLETIIRHHNARILDITPEYTVMEKSGQPWETQALLEQLKPYGVKQFVRSGRVCVTKSPQEKLDHFLEIQEARKLRIK